MRSMQYLGSAYTNKVFLVYSRFTFSWDPCVLSDNPSYKEKVAWSLVGDKCTHEIERPPVTVMNTDAYLNLNTTGLLGIQISE